MSRRAWTNYAAAAGVTLALGAAPAWAQQGTTAERDRQTTGATRADDKAGAATSSTGEKITDAWILTKVKAQFVGEDALEHSDINVDVTNKVVTLKGTVASEAGKARAAEIARATEGVTRVVNNLVIGVANHRSTERDTDMKDAAHDTKQAAKHAGRETRDATGTAGQAVSDGWITTKVKSSFVGVDVLDGSDIDVDTNNHVVTLRGTVASEAARARAATLAKQVDGVTSVKNELKIGAKK